MTRDQDPSLESIRYRPGPHWAAVLAAVCTWPLLLVGGSVTVYGVGMAVPDWPTTFGVNMFLYDFLNSSWGVYLEHTHRLYGSLVGLACIVLAFWVTLSTVGWRKGLPLIAATLVAGFVPLALPATALPDGLSVFFLGLSLIGVVSLALAAWFGLVGRATVLALAWLALAAVIGQGVLGGYRVRQNSTDLAMVHGVTAQLFFGLTVVLCVMTGRLWNRPSRDVADTSRLRLHASLLLTFVVGQIILGAWLRHRVDAGELASHAGFAVILIPYAVVTAWLALRRRATVPELSASAWAVLVTVSLQLALGILAWYLLRPFNGTPGPVWPAQAAIRIANQGVGALLLGACVVLTLRTFQHLGSPPQSAAQPGTPESAPASRDLETVA